MEVQNLKILPTVPFDDYLKMPGYSYSGIKSEGKLFKAPTAKMHLGTLVHTYLLKPREYNYEQYETVKPIAAAIKGRLGALLGLLQPESCVTADFIHNGFSLPYKGQIDLSIPGRIVIDLKISEMPIFAGIKQFGYDKQVSGYSLSIGAKAALIVACHPKTHQITIVNVPIESLWWEYQTITKGIPL